MRGLHVDNNRVTSAATMTDIALRLATSDDLVALDAVMTAAIDELQKGVLSPEQIAASHAVMGLDRQLVADGTYFVALIDGQIAGCGGWSRRATLYGGDHSTQLREPRLLDPETEPARIRAMYTNPAFARRGVGRAVLAHCEAAARAEGFRQAELMGTMAGLPLYLSAGYTVIEAVVETRGGVPVPLQRMGKPLAMTDAAVCRVGEGLLDHSWPVAHWRHAQHCMATLWLVRAHPDRDLVADLPEIIRSYNVAQGGQNTDSGGYHHTITLFYLSEIQRFSDAHAALGLGPACDALLAGPIGEKDHPLRHWSRDCLMSREARLGFVAPDQVPVVWSDAVRARLNTM